MCPERLREEVTIMLRIWSNLCIMAVLLPSTHSTYLSRKLRGYPEDISKLVRILV